MRDFVYKERLRLYNQGKTHRRYNANPFYTEHKYYSDYMDGWHNRPFRDGIARKPLLARIFLNIASWFGA